jgi:hypothetical protein
MAAQRLGHTEEAKAYLERLRTLMKAAEEPEKEQGDPFLREAEAILQR